MKTVMVRYKVKPEAAAENQRLVTQVFAQLARDKPAGVRYQTFKLGDGVSFMPLTLLDAFKEFTAKIKDRCEEPPVTVEMEPIGRFDSLP